MLKFSESKPGLMFLELAQKHDCGLCSRKFDRAWVVPTGEPFPKNVQPNVEVAFHWFDSHGFPEDMFYEIVMDSITVDTNISV